MEIKIEEIGGIETIRIIDSKTGLDWSSDLSGHLKPDEKDSILSSREEHVWWHNYCISLEIEYRRYTSIMKKLKVTDRHDEYDYWVEYPKHFGFEDQPGVLREAADTVEGLFLVREYNKRGGGKNAEN